MMNIQKAVIARTKMCETDLDRVTSPSCNGKNPYMKNCNNLRVLMNFYVLI